MQSSNGVHHANGKHADSDNRVSSFLEREERPTLSTLSAPQPREGILYVEKVPAGCRKKFVIYSPELRGFWTHYTSKGSKPCYSDHSLCEGGHKKGNLRQNFVIHAYDMVKLKQVFCYLTPGAAEQLLAQVGKGQNLRGLVIEVHRTPGREGRMNVRLDGPYTGDKRVFPLEMDAYPSILNFLGVEDADRPHKRALGSPNDEGESEENG